MGGVWGPGWLRLEEEATPTGRREAAGGGRPAEAPAAPVAPPAPPPWRSVVADWPDAWREQWGRRANDLEGEGLSWREAEGRAFEEMTAEED